MDIKHIKFVLSEHLSNLPTVFNMAKKDLNKQYSGTALGVVWSLLKNLIFVGAYWFTLSIGLKSGKDVGYPYFVWLITGLAAWFLIKDTISPAAASIRNYRYLVTKMKYPVSTIPTFKVMSALMSNVMFLLFVFITAIASGIKPSVYWLQIIYYLFAAAILLIGISLITSAFVVFSRDFEMLINSTVFVLFWVCPILFPITNLTGTLYKIMLFNPFTYIIEGFRESILYNSAFWNNPGFMYFWIEAIIILILGMLVHGKLRHHFADIL